MKFIPSFFGLILVLFSAFCFATNVQLYDQPKADAKVVGNIDLAKGIIPIYTPADNKNWVKVGDPTNGNVGWIKSEDLSSGSSVTFTQRIIQQGSGAGNYQVIQFGTPPKLTPEQTHQLIKLQQQQKSSQESLQKAIQQIVDEINNISKQQYKIGPFPAIMPIIIVPQPKQPQAIPEKKPNS